MKRVARFVRSAMPYADPYSQLPLFSWSIASCEMRMIQTLADAAPGFIRQSSPAWCSEWRRR